MIIVGAFLFNYVLATEQIPNALAAWLTGLDVAPVAFLLIVSLLFLAFGCFLDATTICSCWCRSFCPRSRPWASTSCIPGS